MSCVAFFPWLGVDRTEEVGSYRLVPYVRGKSPGDQPDVSQTTLDTLLSSYVERGSEPIRKCTLLQIRDRQLSDDLSPETISEMFAFSELLATAGLSARRYFNQLGGYCNRDLFRLLVQRFEQLNALAITTRRRDGNTNTVWTFGAYRVFRPEHVVSPMILPMDGRLLAALLLAETRMPPDIWERTMETVLNFNLANTDSPLVSESSEMLLLCGAIERTLGSESNEHDLAARFTSMLVPASSLGISEAPRLQPPDRQKSFKRAASVRDAWIRDFFRLRGNVAHGHGSRVYPAAWSTQEHLLLASVAYPLLLKLTLSREGFYSLTSEDRIFIDSFEKLCAAELFNVATLTDEWPWNVILGEAFIDDWFDDQSQSTGD